MTNVVRADIPFGIRTPYAFAVERVEKSLSIGNVALMCSSAQCLRLGSESVLIPKTCAPLS